MKYSIPQHIIQECFKIVWGQKYTLVPTCQRYFCSLNITVIFLKGCVFVKNQMKKLACLLLALVMMAGILPVSARADDFLDSGSCGDNVTWTLTYGGKLTISGDGAMDDYSSYQSIPWYKNRGRITSVVVDSGVTTIGDHAFDFCKLISDVELPEGLTSIGNDAFYSCDLLKSVIIPNGVTSIGSGAFKSCRSLSNVEIPNSVTVIGGGAFQFCESLPNIHIPNSVTSIGDSAFYGCDSLTSITLPNSIEYIHNGTFGDCGTLQSINVPLSFKGFDTYTFTKTTIKNVYYEGDEDQWGRIIGVWDIDTLAYANKHFNSSIYVEEVAEEVEEGIEDNSNDYVEQEKIPDDTDSELSEPQNSNLPDTSKSNVDKSAVTNEQPENSGSRSGGTIAALVVVVIACAAVAFVLLRIKRK